MLGGGAILFLVVLLRLAVLLCGFGLILYFHMKNIPGLSDTILQMVDHMSDSPEPEGLCFRCCRLQQ